MTFYVYALIDPRDDAIRYVGKSSNPAKRLQSHCSRSAAVPIRTWLADLAVAPTLEILAECPTETDALLREQEWVRRLRASGAKLLNALVVSEPRANHPAFSGLGERVAALRTTRRLSQVQLANMTGMDQSCLCRLEHGQRQGITVQTGVKLARALGTTVEWLVTGEDSAASKAG